MTEFLPFLSVLPDHPEGLDYKQQWARKIGGEAGRKLLNQWQAKKRLRNSIQSPMEENEDGFGRGTVQYLKEWNYVLLKHACCAHPKLQRAFGWKPLNIDFRNPNISLVPRERG